MLTTNPPRANATDAIPWRHWLWLIGLIALATGASAWLDNAVSLTSQAMIFLLAVVVASYRLGWRESTICTVAAVTAFNFFFVPPRWTLAVEHHEHFIALAVMLAVGLTITRLAAGLRRAHEYTALNGARARQLHQLAVDVAAAQTAAELLDLGFKALQVDFAEVAVWVVLPDGSDLLTPAEVPAATREGLQCCLREAAVLGPGTGRWPGLEAWYLPLGSKGRMAGAACVKPVQAHDDAGREHATALCALLGNGLWRLRLADAVLQAQAQSQRQQLQSTLLAAVSHDLRTPLAAIIGAASSLRTQRDRLSQAEQDRLLSSMESEAAYLSAVTENTLHLVRLAQGPAALRLDWESIEELWARCLRVCVHATRRGASSCAWPAGFPWSRPIRCCLRSCLITCSTTP